MHRYLNPLVISVPVLVVCLLAYVTFKYSEVSPTNNLSCSRLHAGEVNVDVYYSSDVLFSNIGPDNSHIPLYKTIVRDTMTPDTLFVINIWEAFPQNVAPESLLSIGDIAGPRFNEIVSFNGLSAALANENGWYHYLIPFGNRIIGVDYITTDLTEEEKQHTDNVLRNVKFSPASKDIGAHPQVEQCL